MNNKNSDDSIHQFSQKYDSRQAQSYYQKHQHGFWRNLSNRGDQRIARNALKDAGEPLKVLDIPCGAGRFWPLLAAHPERELYAMDYSQDMLDMALAAYPELAPRMTARQASAFDIPLPDKHIDCVFCIRLIHHLGDAADRIKLLQELKRVSNGHIIISLWVDGNYQSWRRIKKEQKRPSRAYQNRFILPRRQFEAEVEQCGLKIIKHYDLVPRISIWRTYLLAV